MFQNLEQNIFQEEDVRVPCIYTHTIWELLQATRSLLCLCYVFWVLISSLVCWFWIFNHSSNMWSTPATGTAEESLCLSLIGSHVCYSYSKQTCWATLAQLLSYNFSFFTLLTWRFLFIQVCLSTLVHCVCCLKRPGMLTICTLFCYDQRKSVALASCVFSSKFSFFCQPFITSVLHLFASTSSQD